MNATPPETKVGLSILTTIARGGTPTGGRTGEMYLANKRDVDRVRRTAAER